MDLKESFRLWWDRFSVLRPEWPSFEKVYFIKCGGNGLLYGGETD